MDAFDFRGNKPQLNMDKCRCHFNKQAFELNLEETFCTQLRPSHGKK